MRRVALVGLIAACGSAAKPANRPVVAVVKVKTPPRTEPNCEDMGPLLRRAFAPDGGDDSILETITSECRDQHWSAEVLACVADTPELNANDCMAKLNGEQTASLNSVVAGFSSWGEDYEVAPELQCADVVQATDVAEWEPAVPETDRDLARELRRPALAATCTTATWEQPMLDCILAASDPAKLHECVELMEPDLRTAVDGAIAGADAALKKMAPAMKAASCDKVVAAHYAAAKWKGQAPTLVGGSRTKVIATSKKLMRDACTAEAWSVDVRACIVAVDEPMCWKLAKLGSDEQTWTYPAEGTVPFSLGVAECDDWGAEVGRLFRCQAVPEDLRQSMRSSFNSVKESFKDMSRLTKETLQQSLPAIATSCREARDAVAQVAQKAGC
ncbi:MAG TPA: hypothetical protein VGM90_04625 [Kofleriaceae bacterium]|jgi:hypothetical protein